MHYPEYCERPYDMVTWLYGQAKQHEQMWSKPKQGGERKEGANSSDEDTKEPTRGLGFMPKPQKNKKLTNQEEQDRKRKADEAAQRKI